MTTYKQPPTTFDELTEPLPQEVQNIAYRLRKSIRKTLPEVDENVSGGKKMGMALYSFESTNNVICGIQPTEKMCKLYFHGWKQLIKQGFEVEGSGKNARHIKFRSESDCRAEVIEEMLLVVKNELMR